MSRLAVKQALKLVLVTMITNNTEEVTTLVDRLEGEITGQAIQVLLETTYDAKII